MLTALYLAVKAEILKTLQEDAWNRLCDDIIFLPIMKEGLKNIKSIFASGHLCYCGIKAVLANGAQTDRTDQWGKTAFHLATEGTGGVRSRSQHMHRLFWVAWDYLVAV